jgi:serine/threonine-protein kinase
VEAALTREGSIIGTVSYMSPEQAEGKHVDARSDIFSFGDVLYEMVTGKRAFEGRSGISTLSSILRDDVRPIYESAPDVPPLLEQIILRCLPKDPAARWQSMKEIETALITLLRQLDPGGHYVPPVPGSPISIASVPAANSADASTGEEAPFAAPIISPPAIDPEMSATHALPTQPGGSPRAPVAGTAKPKSPAIAKPPRNRSARFVALLLAVIGAVLVASAAIGGWWWWKSQQANNDASTSVTPPPAAAPVPQPSTPAAGTPPSTAPAPEPAVTPAPTASEPSPANSAKRVRKPKPKPSDKSATPTPPLPEPATPTTVAPFSTAPPSTAVTPPKPAPRTPAVQTIPVSVSDALPFVIVLAQDVPADAAEGVPLTFTVSDGLKIGDRIVIAKGATVTGAVSGEVKQKKFLGIGGGRKTMFRLFQADAVDGKKLAVRAMAGRNEDGVTVRTFDTGKGSKAKGFAAMQGTVYIAYVDGDQTVAVRK